MSLEFILQLADGTCYDGLSCLLVDRDPDSLFAASWTYEDGWKLLLDDAYYTTSSTTQNTLSSCFSKLQRVPDSIFTFGSTSSNKSNVRLRNAPPEAFETFPKKEGEFGC